MKVSEPIKENNDSRARQIYIVTAIGSLVNLGLFLFKLFAGIFGRSTAMVADAFHSLSDFITDIIVVVFVRISSKPADRTHRYGHGKFETLATTCIALSMGIVGLVLFIHAVDKIVLFCKGEPLETPKMLALWAALLSILSKEILFHYTRAQGKKLDSSAVVANAWHHRSDALSSICTALGIGGAIIFGGKMAVLDPIAAAIVSIFIINIGIKTMKPSLDELLERSLPEPVIKEIVESIVSIPGVGYPHHLMTRRIGMRYAIEFNLHLDPDTTLEDACRKSDKVVHALKAKYGPGTHVGIHFKIKNQE